jgi:hypothetical protein
MPAATCKTDLIAVTQKEYAKLQKLIAPLDETTAIQKADDISIKDVIGHRAHWISLFLGWYHDGQAGKEVHFPAPGYKWNKLPRYNAALRAEQAGMSWEDACDLLSENTDKLLDFMESRDNTALYGGPMKGANNNWTPGRWAEAAGPSHFRSAAKYIRKALKSEV